MELARVIKRKKKRKVKVFPTGSLNSNPDHTIIHSDTIIIGNCKHDIMAYMKFSGLVMAAIDALQDNTLNFVFFFLLKASQ